MESYHGHAREGGNWIAVSRQRPCIVCGKPDWCTITADGGTIHCRRGHSLPAPAGYQRSTTAIGDAARFVRERGTDSLAFEPSAYRVVTKSPAVAPAPAKDWSRLADEFQQAGHDRLQPLADDLAVGVEALRGLGVGWNGYAWTVPARDATGAIIGLATRFRDGGKRFVSKSRHGLFYDPALWHQGDGPVLLVEGMSDAAALAGLGLSVIGRPSNVGGVSLLVEMLTGWPEDRGIVVVGERDQKPDGAWPGREGAMRTAQQLAEGLYRDIAWTLPPEPFKDSRALVQSGVDAESVVFGYADAAQVVIGPPRPPHEAAIADTAAPRRLEEYREDLRLAKPNAMRQVGVSVDRAPTGAGKTRSTTEALLHVGILKSVQALPTHANVKERESEMIAAGHDPKSIGVMPDLTPDNCAAFEVASAAREAGMSHGLAVCRGCPHKRGCEYAGQAKAAQRRKHLLTTAEHYRRSWHTQAMRKREIVIVDEKPDETLAPMVECTAEDIHGLMTFLDAVVADGNARAVRTLEDWGRAPSPVADGAVEAAQTADHLRSIAGVVLELANATTEPGVQSRDVDFMGPMGNDWQQRMLSVVTGQGVTPPPQEAMRLVLALASGVADTAWASCDRHETGDLSVHVFVHWRVDLEGKRVLLLDGTADVERLSKLAGTPVRDITPAGRIRNVHEVVQRPIPVSMSTSTRRVQSILLAVLDDQEQHHRVGLIGHKRHVAALLGDGPDALPAAARERIVKASWFGHGPDRASNEWHVACDVLLVIGTPRPNPGSIRRRLVVQGDVTAATMPTGEWVAGTWEATDVEGKPVVLTSRGYADPSWRAAHQGVVRAGLRQAIGRARAGLPEGVPCVVLSDEPLGLPVDLRPVLVRRSASQRVLAAMRASEAAARAANERGEADFVVETLASGQCANNRGSRPIRYRAPPIGRDPLLLAQSSSVVISTSGLPPRDCHRALVALANEAAVHQPEPGFWSLGAKPAGSPGYAHVTDREAGVSGLGRPPDTTARIAGAKATVGRLADSTHDGIVTTGQFVQAEATAARRTAIRKLSEAVEAGEVVQLERGKFAADLPVTSVRDAGRSARIWIDDLVLGFEITSGSGRLVQPPRMGQE
jgi:hypothetical protein